MANKGAQSRGGRSVRRGRCGHARSLAAALAVGLLIALSGTSAGAAQTELPAAPEPDACAVEPRALPLWNGTPSAVIEVSQPNPDLGFPVDDATLRGITSTVIEAAACANAAQPLRSFALVTDEFLARQFTGENAADAVESGAALERPEPTPSRGDYLTVVSIEDATEYEDGTVSAMVTTENQDGTYIDLVVFIEGDTRWLIDASFPLDDGSGSAA